MIVTAAFIFIPGALTELYLDSNNPSAQIAVKGFPLFSAAFVFFIFNLTAIGYFQSVEKVIPSIAFALLRGLIFLVPSFLLMPVVFGDAGMLLALFVSKSLTSASIIIYYFCNRCKTKPED
ncbi:MAG: hypothetical protein K2K08_06945 [Paramuribaculum sp.]|nr:hypothetical protein [Paramuribaculum sp.]